MTARAYSMVHWILSLVIDERDQDTSRRDKDVIPTRSNFRRQSDNDVDRR